MIAAEVDCTTTATACTINVRICAAIEVTMIVTIVDTPGSPVGAKRVLSPVPRNENGRLTT